MMKRLVVPSLVAVLLATPALAQVGPSWQPPSSISASAQQEAKVAPDKATLSISVMTRATTAAAAATENAKKQTAVLYALRSLGLTNEQLSTTGYSVQPEYRYQPNKDPQLIGYSVTNTITVDIRDLKTIGKVIDAALGAGANQISSLEFYASNTDSARQQAVATAIARARADAQVAARAAGGTLGELLEMTITGDRIIQPPRPIMFKTMAAGAADESTPINPGDQTVVVNISTRWKFNSVTGR